MNIHVYLKTHAVLLKYKHRDTLEWRSSVFTLLLTLAFWQGLLSPAGKGHFKARYCSKRHSTPFCEMFDNVSGAVSTRNTRHSALLSSYKHSHTLSNTWQLYYCCQELKGAITPYTIQKIKPSDRNSFPKGSPVKVIKETTLQGLPQATALDH